MMDANEIRARIDDIGGVRAYVSDDVIRKLHGHHRYEVSYEKDGARWWGSGDSWAAALQNAMTER